MLKLKLNMTGFELEPGQFTYQNKSLKTTLFTALYYTVP